MKILFLGDVVGGPGRAGLRRFMPELKAKLAPDVVIINGENSAANNMGMRAEDAAEIFAAGADVITLGDHTFDQKGFEDFLAGAPKVIRPANYQKGTIGRGFVVHTITTGPCAGKRVGVLNLQGRAFMRHQIDCPIAHSRAFMAEHTLGEHYDALLIDMHAEATAEKAVMGYVWDGFASAVVGTHTHIPTADWRVQAAGTAFITDAGMCGDYRSSLGMTLESVLAKSERQGRMSMQAATGDATLCGVLITVAENGLATGIKPVRMGPVLEATLF